MEISLEKQLEIAKFEVMLNDALVGRKPEEQVQIMRELAMKAFTQMINREHVVGLMLKEHWGLENNNG